MDPADPWHVDRQDIRLFTKKPQQCVSHITDFITVSVFHTVTP